MNGCSSCQESWRCAERHLAVQLMSLPASLVPVSPAIHKYAVPVQGPGDPLTTAVAPVGPPTISIRYNLNSVTSLHKAWPRKGRKLCEEKASRNRGSALINGCKESTPHFSLAVLLALPPATFIPPTVDPFLYSPPVRCPTSPSTRIPARSRAQNQRPAHQSTHVRQPIALNGCVTEADAKLPLASR